MSKLQKERLNQMIENALSYKQEVIVVKSFSLDEKLKYRKVGNFIFLDFLKQLISLV